VNEFAKTGVFVGGAAALVVLAMLSGPHAVDNAYFSDEGQALFTQFNNPQQAVSLEVWEFNKDRGEMVPFKVTQGDKGLWTIPSHSDYPADAKTRMAKAAAMVIGSKRDKVISDEPADYSKFNVVDPTDDKLKLEGRGIRATFKDKGGTVLADLILGKEVEGKSGYRYVRLPDKKRIYAVKLDADLSTRFEDWIERDLLKTSSWDLSQVLFDNYKVDEAAGGIVPGDKLTVKKDDAAGGKWVLDGLAQSEETNEDKLREITDTVTQLKIVGVRPKPQGLTANLEQANGFDRQILLGSLQSKGYYLGRNGKMYSNDGDLVVSNKKGVVYTLKFGQVVFGEGDAVTSGKEDSKPKQPKDAASGPQPQAQNNRYLMVTAQFDASLLKKPEKPRLEDKQLEQRKQAKEQIEAIVKAITAWQDKHDKKLPEALAQLTEKPAEGEPLLKELKKDPWEQDYQYKVDGDKFVVSSFGEDKAAGGDGANADISSDKLPFEDELRTAVESWKTYDKQVTDGKKEADGLTRRFGQWYYVIDQASFAKLKPARKDLVKEKAPPKPPENGTPAATDTTPPKEPGKQ